MNLTKTLDRINKDRQKTECCFVMSLWKDPELYADYLTLNEGKDETIKTEDAKFYFNLGKAMYKQGYRSFDGITLNTFLSTKPSTEKHFEEYGGMHEVEQLKGLIHTDNLDAYYDVIRRMNALSLIAQKYDEAMENIGQFENMSSEDVFNAFDLLNTTAALQNGSDTKIEDLVLDDDFINSCETGTAMGLDYSENCPVLNYITLGIPLGEMFMVAGHSGIGKSSWAFENLVLPLNKQGIKVAIISNEMRSEAYKHLLLIHILTKDFNYWDMTRKQIKTGGFTDEQKTMLKKAQKKSAEDYADIRFVKLFDKEINKVIKFIRKLAHQGYQAIIWDTMKSDDVVDDQMWQQLVVNSRRIFQIASKNNIAIIPTYQLALYTQNQRFLDASCLSSSKQIKEVFSEMIYMRPLWEDEYTGEKHDCKAYKLNKDENGIYQKEMIELDPEKNYIVVFVDKTRNDAAKQQILYSFNGRFNSWKEIGRCTIRNDHNRGDK